MSNNESQSKLVELLSSESGNHLAEKLAPLLQLNRLDNIVDLLSLVSDLVDILGKVRISPRCEIIVL
ncbi:hypothetical protein [Providencia rettgeri]|uniref:hypothetical protein n=1 Tax=Providencia rettgeri TaxID=587 RepID=UPI0015EB30D9|nr:hypothetical protein [Providencia rettgeri]QLR03162.1 hypothetical protein H0913_14640 [Providencia rettgeri]